MTDTNVVQMYIFSNRDRKLYQVRFNITQILQAGEKFDPLDAECFAFICKALSQILETRILDMDIILIDTLLGQEISWN